jgi:anti-anti-sigma factor
MTQCGDADIRMDQSGSRPALSVTGRVTVNSSPRLRSVLFEAISKSSGLDFIVDFSAVTHIDVSGLAVLLEAAHCARQYSVCLHLAGISGQPRRLVEIAQLDQIFRASGSEVEFR